MADRWSGITGSFIFLKKEYCYKFNCQDPAWSFRQKFSMRSNFSECIFMIEIYLKCDALKQNISLNVTFLTLLVVKFVKF